MVLAAGLGTRLRPLTFGDTEAGNLPVLDRPVMAHIVDLLDRHGFEDVVANLHWFPETITSNFGDRIEWRHEAELLGTARRAQLRRLLRRRAVPGDLGRRADRSTSPRQPPGTRRPGGSPRCVVRSAKHARVRRRAARPRGADHRLPGEARARRGAVGSRQLRHLRLLTGDLRALSRQAVRRLGPRTSSQLCSRTTCRSPSMTSARSNWNDVGSLDELRAGTFDALAGKLQLDIRGRGDR